MLRGASTSDIAWLVLVAGLFLFALWQAWARRGRAWPFRLGFLALTLGLFLGRFRSLPGVAGSTVADRLRLVEAPLAVASLVLILGALVTRRIPSSELNGDSHNR
jgi:hypothetical protein